MNNQERYQRAFQPVTTNTPIVLHTAASKPVWWRQPAAALGAAVVMCLLSVSAYGYDVNGIRSTVQGWIQGESRAITYIETEPGSFDYSYEVDGKQVDGSGGGVSMDAFGKETPIRAEDFLDSMASGVMMQADGSMLYYDKQWKLEVPADWFDEAGHCYLHVVNGEEQYYLRLDRYENGNIGFTTSPHPAWFQDYREMEIIQPKP